MRSSKCLVYLRRITQHNFIAMPRLYHSNPADYHLMWLNPRRPILFCIEIASDRHPMVRDLPSPFETSRPQEHIRPMAAPFAAETSDQRRVIEMFLLVVQAVLKVILDHRKRTHLAQGDNHVQAPCQGATKVR